MKKIIREFLIIVIVALICTNIVYAVDYGIIENDAYLDSVYIYNAGGHSTQLKASSTATANNIIYLRVFHDNLETFINMFYNIYNKII